MLTCSLRALKKAVFRLWANAKLRKINSVASSKELIQLIYSVNEDCHTTEMRSNTSSIKTRKSPA